MRVLSVLTCVALGFLVGHYFTKNEWVQSSVVKKNSKKLSDLLRIIEDNYVDAIGLDSLTEYAINSVLEKLDPHSSYTPAADTELELSGIKGGFDGIGVSFYIFDDSVVVENTMPQGPAHQAGIQAGDRLIGLDGAPFFPKESRQVIDKLRGEKGSVVKLDVFRNSKTFTVSLYRNSIVTSSIEAAFLVKGDLGYIKLSRFSASSHSELQDKIIKLKKQGMRRLILDLQGNTGGLLDQAIKIADDFLPEPSLILFTQGKNPRNDSRYFANRTGVFEKGELWVLIDENSASASEILAGALQDNDRAVLVGRRSYGKGLVQRPITLQDGSMLKITVSRYFTPTGRSIQKPYTSRQNYNNDLLGRYESGEYFDPDSVKYDSSNAYKTKSGKLVFGGGGISPDVFVPKDTTQYSKDFFELYAKSVVREVAAREAARLGSMNAETFLKQYEFNDLALLRKTAAKVGIALDSLKSVSTLIASQVKAQIGRVKYGDEFFYRVFLQRDAIFNKALQVAGD
jgi:carboxyl-terminal processing protease